MLLPRLFGLVSRHYCKYSRGDALTFNYDFLSLFLGTPHLVFALFLLLLFFSNTRFLFFVQFGHRRKNTGEPSIGSPVFSIQLISTTAHFNVSGLGLYLRQRLINVGDYILGILDA